ncbi:conserved hypothetical protein [Desulfamplus magnetovallimortis]|uniref:Uncharacterized protein n=2 Tax=Desulfamplus magnetovallimortis TaxID=1246637 RepID=A0A1W1HKG1_9BACT|nr:conserved hypothetical protein [Desulfamplus magnetovallimortis]
MLAYHTNMKAKLIKHNKLTDELGNTIEVKIWSVAKASDKPHGFKYSLVYIVNGERVVGYDNAEGKGDHKHLKQDSILKEIPYQFESLRKLVDDFLKDMENIKGGGL